MGVIHLLDEALASQIAAGEVVERPASVAKELLENAVDAGASAISVYVAGGGIERLCVTDDGRGMSADDAALCFSRHATSKLRALDDLKAINTFGFRGEALAAIASVSKVTLRTRPPGTATAVEVRVEGGHIVHIGEAGAPIGTRVDVRDLFYNVPARRKFLKTARTEAAHVENVVKDAGLSLPHVGLRFDGDGRRTLDLGAAPDNAPLDDPRRLERVVRCLGEQVRDQLLPIDEATDLLRVRGYLVAPIETRRDGVGLRVSVNGRPVSDRGLAQAIKLAYRPLLEVGRLPLCALDVILAPELVDVNVHPRKAEVRFEDPRRVHGHVIRLISDYLARAPWRQAAPARTYLLGKGASTGQLPIGGQAAPPLPLGSGEDPAAVHRARVRDALARFQARVQGRRPAPAAGAAVTSASVDGIRVMGTVGGQYVLASDREGLLVFDKEAVATRLAHRSMRAALAAGPLDGQPMLFPLRMELSPVEAEALEDKGPLLMRFGLDVELFGEGIGLCRSVPSPLDTGRAEEAVREALRALTEGPGVPGAPTFDELLLGRLAPLARTPEADLGLVRRALDLDPESQRGALVRLGPDDIAAWFAT
jgi:DNA mismatch repair protein MutL